MNEVKIFTDGSALSNPGKGGYGVVIYENNERNEYSCGFKNTTNNKMELLGVIVGLSKIKEPSKITITTDSQYVCKAFNDHWIDNWIRNGWKTSTGKPVLNKEFWEKLLELKQDHDVKFVWVKGHNGHPENERCDRLANTAARESSDTYDDIEYLSTII